MSELSQAIESLAQQLSCKHCVAITTSDETVFEPSYIILLDPADNGLTVSVKTEGGEDVVFTLRTNEVLPIRCIMAYLGSTAVTPYRIY